MHRLLRLLSTMSRWERWTLLALCVLFLLSVAGLVRRFYLDETVLMPAIGGTYIEGSVGDLHDLNPWFTVENDVNRDIVSLVFAGLLKYNPLTRRIEDDLAYMQASPDSTTFTLRLKDDIYWQDSTPKDPHPVTADDVVFTFTTIQNPQFPNPLLQQNFRGVHLERVDDRTVRFHLDEAYSFFPSNLTLGLLPKRAFDGIPVSKLDLASDFSARPIGAGPYKVRSIVQTDLSTEVTLERFQRQIPPPYRLDRVVFRIFPDYPSLLSDIRNLHGIRLVPRSDRGEPITPKRFRHLDYSLPQYVGLFFNLSRKNLQDRNLRLGLQLGTNKRSLADSIHQTTLVDTPLLELDTSDWRYKFDPVAAQGALFASNWNVPEKMRLQQLLQQRDTNLSGDLKVPFVVYAGSGGTLTISGAITDAIPLKSRVNNIPLRKTGTGAWRVDLPIAGAGTGALPPGLSILRLTQPSGTVVDTAYIYNAQHAEDRRRAEEEHALVEAFVRTRDGQSVSGDQVTVEQMYLQNGMLRRRTASDAPSIRKNDKGEELVLTLLTSDSPPEYRKAAQFIQQAWADLGVRVKLDIPSSRAEFQDKLLRRNYDVLLFGQSLLDNLDSYSYWHSSGVQKLTQDGRELRQDAYNLSQYSSRKADTLLDQIRHTSDEKQRTLLLKDLRGVLAQDVPAVFLYSPRYSFALHQSINGVELGSLSLHSDRFLSLSKWYVRQERVFKAGRSWLSFGSWVLSLLHHVSSQNI